MQTVISILGQLYGVYTKSITDMLNEDGKCNSYSKDIHIRKLEDLFNEDESVTDEDRKVRIKEVIRHEVVHAFLYESGLDDSDEQLVDWIAKQLPKIHEVSEHIIKEVEKEYEQTTSVSD